ncbi:hypothetical protein BH11PLA2_BH11PLA2_34380 [soil metagenome]
MSTSVHGFSIRRVCNWLWDAWCEARYEAALVDELREGSCSGITLRQAMLKRGFGPSAHRFQKTMERLEARQCVRSWDRSMQADGHEIKIRFYEIARQP